MPKIAPPGGPVDWPRDEGTIGVVGVAPWATIDFLRALYAQVSAARDWHYPRVIADVNTKLPSRGRHLDLGETDPSPFIAATIGELAAQGATVVVVPCNTAHVLYRRWSAGATVAVPSIIDATVADIARAGARRVAVLASLALRRHGVYERALRDAGLEPVEVDDDGAKLVAAAIDEVKRTGRIGDPLEAALAGLLTALVARGADGIVLGCTELASLVPHCIERVGPVAESNQALARAALVAAGVPND